jgi:hypothetical protein
MFLILYNNEDRSLVRLKHSFGDFAIFSSVCWVSTQLAGRILAIRPGL